MKIIIPETLKADSGQELRADCGYNNQPGEIYFANQDRFSSSNYSGALTGYGTGWTDTLGIRETLNFIAPQVVVPRRFEFRKANNSQEFLSEFDDVRAIGSGFKRVEYTGTTTDEKTLNKGLTTRIDRDEMMDGDIERAVMRLKTRLYRNDLRRAFAALSIIDAAGSNRVWDDVSAPDGDVFGAMVMAGDLSGMNPNRVLYGLGAWTMRYHAYDVQKTAGARMALTQQPEDIAKKFNLEGGVFVSKERYQATQNTKSRLVSDVVIAFYAEESPGKDDATVVKRFVTPVGEAETGMRVYVQESDKWIDVSVEHYSNIVTTSTVAAKKLNISAS